MNTTHEYQEKELHEKIEDFSIVVESYQFFSHLQIFGPNISTDF